MLNRGDCLKSLYGLETDHANSQYKQYKPKLFKALIVSLLL